MLKRTADLSCALRTSLLMFALIFVAFSVRAQSSNDEESVNDSLIIDLPFPFGGEDQFNPIESPEGFDFAWPSNFTYQVVLDEETGMYSIQQLVGDTIEYRPSTFLTLDEYLNFDMEGNLTEYWNELQVEDDEAERAFARSLRLTASYSRQSLGAMRLKSSHRGLQS